MTSYWLIVERLENWKVDKKEGFRRFGLPKHKEKLANDVKKGDRFVVYVSGSRCAFADIREAVSDGCSHLGIGGNYADAFPLAISTKPVLVLEPDNWVLMLGLVKSLSFTRDKKDWRQVMRTSLRRLCDGDAQILTRAMSKHGGWVENQ